MSTDLSPSGFVPGAVKLGMKSLPPEKLRMRCHLFRNYANPSQLPAAPASTNRRAKLTVPWGMAANDANGCCTESANLHAEMLWAVNSGQPLTVSVTEMLATYYRLTGGPDTGLVITDELNDWLKTPVCPSNGNKLAGYVSILADQRHGMVDHEAIVTATFLTEVCSAGVMLPAAWQGADAWAAPSRAHRFGAWAPGSWGGHCVPIVDYDATHVYVVSWGQIIPVTWAAVTMYFTEVHPLLNVLAFNLASGKTPDGFDLQQLQADMQQLAA